MPFAQRLHDLRQKNGFTQQKLAESVEMSVLQIRRYEAGKAQPTLDVIKRLSVTLGVTADELIFEPNERGPDADLLLEFEAISRFSEEEKKTVKGVLKGLILKHQADRWGDRPAATT
jgi:transcriptional regulator with XRE-family HTH domain